MKRRRQLPASGIQCKGLPRLKAGGSVVSASTVRQAIHDDRLEDVAVMLPETTLRYLRSDEAKPVINAIRAAEHVIHD